MRRTISSSPNLSEHCDVFEIEDILVTRFRGDYSLEIAKELQLKTNLLAKRHGYRLLLLDLTHLGVVTRQARAFLVEDQRQERKPSAVAIIGASFAIRTLATMMIRAVCALTNTPASLEFFATEEEAQKWLSQERNRLRTSIASANIP